MKTTLKQMNVAVGWLAGLVSSLALLGCGGGGGTPPPEGPRFTPKTENGTPGVFDRDTGITWAAELGGSKGTLPSASELLEISDLPESVINENFSFIKDETLATQNRPTANVFHQWVVHFSIPNSSSVDTGYGPGELSLEPVVQNNPGYKSWFVINRKSSSVTPSLVNNYNGTVTSSNLMWKFCSEGSSFSRPDKCSQAATLVSSTDTLLDMVKNANKNYFAGYNDWRLPTRRELRTLLDLSDGVNIDDIKSTLLRSPFVNDTPLDLNGNYSDLSYWTSDYLEKNSKRSFWHVNFSAREANGRREGGVFFGKDDFSTANIITGAYVRLVRYTN